MGSGTVEIITGRERLRCWSVADKFCILAECDAHGVQVAEVAPRHGIYGRLVLQWRRQERDSLLVAEPMPEFVPVRVAAYDRQDEMLPEPEPKPPLWPSSRKAAAIEIHLPDSIRVRVGNEVTLVALRRVLAALRG